MPPVGRARQSGGTTSGPGRGVGRGQAKYSPSPPGASVGVPLRPGIGELAPTRVPSEFADVHNSNPANGWERVFSAAVDESVQENGQDILGDALVPSSDLNEVGDNAESTADDGRPEAHEVEAVALSSMEVTDAIAASSADGDIPPKEQLRNRMEDITRELSKSVQHEFGMAEKAMQAQHRAQLQSIRTKTETEVAQLVATVAEGRAEYQHLAEQLEIKHKVVKSAMLLLQKVRANVTGRSMVKSTFCLWSAAVAAGKDARLRTHVARCIRHRQLGHLSFGAWRRCAQTSRREACFSNLRASQDIARRQLMEQMDAEREQLRAEGEGLRQQLFKETQQRALLQENLKRVFMRGVCALNFEAMTLLADPSGATGPSIGASLIGSSPVPTTGQFASVGEVPSAQSATCHPTAGQQTPLWNDSFIGQDISTFSSSGADPGMMSEADPGFVMPCAAAGNSASPDSLQEPIARSTGPVAESSAGAGAIGATDSVANRACPFPQIINSCGQPSACPISNQGQSAHAKPDGKFLGGRMQAAGSVDDTPLPFVSYSGSPDAYGDVHEVPVHAPPISQVPVRPSAASAVPRPSTQPMRGSNERHPIVSNSTPSAAAPPKGLRWQSAAPPRCGVSALRRSCSATLLESGAT